MKRVCKQCGKEFELSESEIRFYERKGLELPKRCQECRDQNKRMAAPSNAGSSHKHYVIAAAVAILFLVSFLGKYAASDVSDTTLQGENTIQKSIENGFRRGVEAETADTITAHAVDHEASQSDVYAIDHETVQSEQDVQSEGAYETASQHTYEFRKHRYLTEHFEKHGEEFPYDTEEAYLQGANKVINNPDALHKLEAEDGDDVYYIEATNEFVVVSTDGYIRTYFKADIDYYNRQ